MCAVCAVMNVAAQTVASSPTAVSALKSGYYVLKMKSDKTDADGSFVYRNGSNVMFDAKGAAHDLTGKAVDDVSYVFYVANDGGQLTIKAFDKTIISGLPFRLLRPTTTSVTPASSRQSRSPLPARVSRPWHLPTAGAI